MRFSGGSRKLAPLPKMIALPCEAIAKMILLQILQVSVRGQVVSPSNSTSQSSSSDRLLIERRDHLDAYVLVLG